jgi:hypothetical protein
MQRQERKQSDHERYSFLSSNPAWRMARQAARSDPSEENQFIFDCLDFLIRYIRKKYLDEMKRKKNRRSYQQRIAEELWRVLTPEGQTPCCAICSRTDSRMFTTHHFNADGKEDRARFGNHRNGLKMKVYYTKHPDEARMKLQIVCYLCHKEKFYETLQLRKRRKKVVDSYRENNNSINA